MADLMERAADALRGADTADYHDAENKDYLAMVRAVLQAIREPSDAMTEAGSIASYDLEREERAVEGEGTNAVWQAMIDAALQ